MVEVVLETTKLTSCIVLVKFIAFELVCSIVNPSDVDADKIILKGFVEDGFFIKLIVIVKIDPIGTLLVIRLLKLIFIIMLLPLDVEPTVAGDVRFDPFT
jgi:hypothetical protein